MLLSAERLSLHQLIHAVQALVVLLKAAYLLARQGQVFLLELEHPSQVLDVSLKLLILPLNALREALLVLEVSPEGGDLAIPEVELILL